MAGISNPLPVSDGGEPSSSSAKNPESSGVNTGDKQTDSSDFLNVINSVICIFLRNIQTITLFQIKGLNLNSYASKKSIAQGLLDIALVVSNATQLKNILTVGETYPFYTLLVALIITSLCLQVINIFLFTCSAKVF